jgi:conjugative transposon TraK protein
MLTRNIENKVKLALITAAGSFITAIVISILVLSYSKDLIQESRNKIYVLDGEVPVLVRQADVEENRIVEYKSHINLFHMLFFNLPPDDAFIKENLSRAMYLVDASGLTEYNNLKEKGYYNSILASSAVLSIRADSIVLNESAHAFQFYGTQRIERKTSILTRQLITEGNYEDVPRTAHNPHGCLITNWRTVLNKDISHIPKSSF